MRRGGACRLGTRSIALRMPLIDPAPPPSTMHGKVGRDAQVHVELLAACGDASGSLPPGNDVGSRHAERHAARGAAMALRLGYDMAGTRVLVGDVHGASGLGAAAKQPQINARQEFTHVHEARNTPQGSHHASSCGASVATAADSAGGA